MRNTNTPAMGAHGALQHLRHYWAQMRMDARSSFSLPKHRRTPKTQVNLRDGMISSRADQAYWDCLTNAKIKQALDNAMESAKFHFQNTCKFDVELNLEQHSVFFAAPCKHFPRMETFAVFGAGSNRG